MGFQGLETGFSKFSSNIGRVGGTGQGARDRKDRTAVSAGQAGSCLQGAQQTEVRHLAVRTKRAVVH